MDLLEGFFRFLMELFATLLGLLIGLVLLVKGADEMIKSAVQIAIRYKIPQSIVGALYIGFGTSAPELVASTIAALEGDLSLAIGNIVGSNIANSLLVIAVLFITLDKKFKAKLDLNLTASKWMLAITLLFLSFYFFMNSFTRILGVVLLCSMIVIIRSLAKQESEIDYEIEKTKTDKLTGRALLSITATIYGSSLVVDNAIELADIFNISSLVVGIAVVALGTSLPEVVSSLAAARMGKPGIVFGNIFGSNLFNIGLVGGTSILISPGELDFNINIQLLVLLIATLFVIVISRQVITKNKFLGIVILTLYLLFIISLF
jgi:cation:H+ antiporter